MTSPYQPTDEQRAVIGHARSAFVTACPGGGKTRTIVERARVLLHDFNDRRGVAFLSFTNTAVEELQKRLLAHDLLPHPLFPGFLGTFDRFVWQFLIGPFGIPGCSEVARLLPDKSKWEIVPYDGAIPLPLECFDRKTGQVIPSKAIKHGSKNITNIKAHEKLARRINAAALEAGRVDFEDVRLCVSDRLQDPALAPRIGDALVARFKEFIIDEAQDCNPADLEIVDWLRRSGLIVKVISDPQQAIYEFRGGVTEELLKFSKAFPEEDRLSLSGNFRSTPAICASVVALRPPEARANPDQALGEYKDDPTPVHILSYAGQGVSPAIGAAFTKLVLACGIPIENPPVVAATHASAGKATGQGVITETRHSTLLLAQAVTGYHTAFAAGNRREALTDIHRAILLIQGHITEVAAYHLYLEDQNLEDGKWRPGIIELANRLARRADETAEQWLSKARGVLAPTCGAERSINQRIKKHEDLDDCLRLAPPQSALPRSIHSVKGMEFPAVCVVMANPTISKILDVLEGKGGDDARENARKIYVGASRAQRLLVFAVPKNSCKRLSDLLRSCGAGVVAQEI